MVNIDTMLHLAKSVAGCVLLSVASYCSQVTPLTGTHGVTSAVRWASVIIILSTVYYLQFQFWRRIWFVKRERRLRGQYRQTSNTSNSLNTSNTSNITNAIDIEVDLDSPPEDWSEGVSVASTVYYPELTMSSVWTYVYGWGVLLFVCIYCLSGMDVPSSCWWVMGMIALSFDELISKNAGKWFICLIGLSLCGSVFAVWSGALLDENGNLIGDLLFTRRGGTPLLNFVMGVIFPVSTPFLFFSIRSPVRLVSKDRDVNKLCEFALPFMTVLAVCCLVSGACGDADPSLDLDLGKKSGVRDLTNYTETVAKFSGSYHNNLDGHRKMSLDQTTIKYSLLFISPFIAFWLIRVLIVAILTGHTTEFITAFLLVTSARYAMTHATGFWPVLALSGSGSAFILLLFNLV
jgi:hypothetical protein